jgi:hypothetical protein
MEINGSTQNPEVEIQPYVPQIPIPDFSFSDEPIGDMGKAWEEWMEKEKMEAAGNSNQPTQPEGRIQISSSPQNKPAAKIVLPRTPEGIQVDSQLLGHVEKLKFSNHDVADERKYPDLAPQVVSETIVMNPLGGTITKPRKWEARLDRTRILGLMKIPHFGKGQYASACVKQLLAVMHGGDVCMEKSIPITIELITQIIGLPIRGMDPTLILNDKSKEKALAEKMKNKYGIDRVTRGIIIKGINNAMTQLGAKILSCKLLRKCCKDEVPAGVIIVASQCTEGTFMS